MRSQLINLSRMDVVQHVLITGNTAKTPMPVGFLGRFAFCPVQSKNCASRVIT